MNMDPIVHQDKSYYMRKLPGTAPLKHGNDIPIGDN